MYELRNKPITSRIVVETESQITAKSTPILCFLNIYFILSYYLCSYNIGSVWDSALNNLVCDLFEPPLCHVDKELGVDISFSLWPCGQSLPWIIMADNGRFVPSLPVARDDHVIPFSPLEFWKWFFSPIKKRETKKGVK